MTFKELESYLGLAYHLPPGHLFRNPIPIGDLPNVVTSGGADVLQPSRSASRRGTTVPPSRVRVAAAVSAQYLGPQERLEEEEAAPAAEIARSRVLVLERQPTSGGGLEHDVPPRRSTATRRRHSRRASPPMPRGRADTTVYYNPVLPNA